MTTDNCIFCKIASGALPSTRVYEDSEFIALMDIAPRTAGHVQVIPKKHYRWVWDVPNAGDYFEVAAKVARAQQKAFGVEKIYSNIAGDDVMHAHIWVYPSESIGDKKDFAGNAKKIQSAF